MSIVSFSPFGYEGVIVTIEVDLRRGIPAIDIVGLADSAVKEARERMRAAITNSGFDFPSERVLINLSPADVKKEGSGFDLAIALAVLQAKNQGATDIITQRKVLILGELELSGKIRAVRGVHAAISSSLTEDIFACIIPEENKEDAKSFPNIPIYPVSHLKDALSIFSKIMAPDFTYVSHENFEEDNQNALIFDQDFPLDFGEIVGQDFLLRGLQIAAAGGHNLMTFGPPGCGKTLALQCFPSILPLLDKEESQTVTRIYSLTGLSNNRDGFIQKPPFRMPHQSASLEGIIGGGKYCTPGEISLAHNGVLFLDEAGEFRSTVLQALRIPLEKGSITLSRAGRSTTFPARFQLLLATNPCPCGNFGSENKICICNPRSIEQYWKKFSAPLLDRIDIRIPVQTANHNLMDTTSKKTTSKDLQPAIAKALSIQKSRQSKKNSFLTPEEIVYFCKLSSENQEYLEQAAEKYNFSARAIHSCVKVARTIADMEGSFSIEREHLTEAIEYRKNEGALNICL